jgi:hypothetical protein
MTKRLKVSIWVLFAVTTLLAAVVHTTLWWASSYFIWLSILAITNVVLAILILIKTGCHLGPLIALIVGVLIGQRWLFESIAAQLIWSIRGFAP